MADRPTGTVTFLFTDIEGSTRLWEEHGETMGRAVANHDDLVRRAIECHGGYVFSTGGDSFAAAFSTAHDAVAAAVDAQLSLTGEKWGETPIRVRMAVHTGEAEERAGDFFGSAVNEAARLIAAAHGGQIVASADTARISGGALPDGVGFTDLGEARLTGVEYPVRVVQLTHPDLDMAFPSLAGLVETPQNLPQVLTSFVGRESELDEMTDLMRYYRLVTLTGAGGSGKTRLALRFAAGVLDDYPGGVWFVDLAVVNDPGRVAPTVARTIGVAEAEGNEMVNRLVRRLEGRTVLLILDNCEHVIDAAASLTAQVLGRTETVRVIATSRQPLGVVGEQQYVVPTLTAPVDLTTDPEAACDFAAVQLFCDRAQAVQRGFEVTVENAGTVGSICHRLDGLPLALELAAARLNVLTPHELHQRLDDRFSVLAGGSRGRVDRHQTLAATLDWSYRLLTADEQTLLNRLSVFVSGFTLETAEQVATGDEVDPGRVLDLVAGLVDKSLLIAYQGAVGRRFRFLETVRAYATDRLADSDELNELAERHAGYFQRLAVDSYNHLWGPDEVEVLDRLDEEWPNLRRSFDWHLDNGRTPDGQMMVGSLRSFYGRRHHLTEGLDLARRFVDADPTPGPERARALQCLASLSDADEDASLWHEVLDLYRQYGSKDDLVVALNNAAAAALGEGDLATARRRIAESARLQRSSDDSTTSAQIDRSHTLNMEAALAFEADDDPMRGVALQEESLQCARESGSGQWFAGRLEVLGWMRMRAGDLDGAAAALHEVRQLEQKLGTDDAFPGGTQEGLALLALDRGDTQAAVAHLLDYRDAVRSLRADDTEAWNIADKPLPAWARVAVALGEHAIAAVLLAAYEAHNEDPETFSIVSPFWLAKLEQILIEAKTHLTADTFEAAWNRGLQMTSSEALDYAVDTLSTDGA